VPCDAHDYEAELWSSAEDHHAIVFVNE